MVSHRDQASHLTKQVVELATIISNPKFIDFPAIPTKDTPPGSTFQKNLHPAKSKGKPPHIGDLKLVGYTQQRAFNLQLAKLP